MTEEISALYVHIPFCERKCEYCDFASIPGNLRQEEYVAALIGELRFLAASVPVGSLRSIFFGGGTPSYIEPGNLAAIMQAVTTLFSLDAECEVTLEANPSSTDVDRARQWRQAGFNRVSLGVQALYDDLLTFLGRVHRAADARRALHGLLEAGVSRINCDLIYAIPGLDTKRWRETLQEAGHWPIEHLSCYELTYEPQTPLARTREKGVFQAAGDGLVLQQHRDAVRGLEACGYEQYEVSAYSKPGAECRHNLTYWRNRPYLAAGVGAHGHLPAAAAAPLLPRSLTGDAVAVRYWHSRNLNSYLGAAGNSKWISGFEEVTSRQHEVERILTGLRTSAGVVLADDTLLQESRALHELGLLQLESQAGGVRVWATPRGQELLNEVTARLVNRYEAAA